MCILVTSRRGGSDAELWVAANRDELLHRPWEPPSLLASEPPVFGGRDLIGDGSWLACNLEAGFAVGVTNARRGALAGERSRGQLVVDLARQLDLASAVAVMTELDLTRYGAFNVVAVDLATGWTATNHPYPQVEIGAGAVIAIGNEPLAEPGERVRFAAERAARIADLDEAGSVEELSRLLADHGGEDPLCRHGDLYGTVCSTILRISPAGVDRYLFAAGPPCSTVFRSIDPSASKPS